MTVSESRSIGQNPAMKIKEDQHWCLYTVSIGSQPHSGRGLPVSDNQ